ncbi:MAG: class I SAM-dependent methyltransferase [Hyphomicrobiales bacterium]|nr:class I SAM-dependent methyltransferase [Hyphomicrobiales bacterium]
MIARGKTLVGAYAIAGGKEGKERLDLLSDAMRATTLELLESAGLKRGDRCLDAGSGGGHVALDMARAVGPAGHVTAIDFDPLVTDLARADAKEAGVDNVEFVTADTSTFDGGPFSFIHARYLLSHVREPDRVFARLKALLAPGGTIAVEDIDMSGSFCHPPEPAQDRFQALYTEAVRRGGADANLGRGLPAIALAAGVRDARWRVFQPVYASGPYKRMTAVTMQMIGSTLLKYGLAEEEEIDTLVSRLNAFADDPSTLAALPRIVQVWGTA